MKEERVRSEITEYEPEERILEKCTDSILISSLKTLCLVNNEAFKSDDYQVLSKKEREALGIPMPVTESFFELFIMQFFR